jgi:hypothetical protein
LECWVLRVLRVAGRRALNVEVVASERDDVRIAINFAKLTQLSSRPRQELLAARFFPTIRRKLRELTLNRAIVPSIAVFAAE